MPDVSATSKHTVFNRNNFNARKGGNAMAHKAYLEAIADALAAEIISKAMLLRAKYSVKGEALSRIDAINAALEQMANEMEGEGNAAQ